ncbi:ribosome biogenesis protein YTM1, putative (YTM1) [Plasmodium malariae]|uniref:Ribosome biogenesis protein YTM1, putative (YTM1) n=1 Tax=Plasmodium malariae TaxID=5858 RepID=A0A1A8W2I7_PLAMA|nr:ribosome biogenesis protein YTM1, putative (YTM1) [Plasmodium malariae]
MIRTNNIDKKKKRINQLDKMKNNDSYDDELTNYTSESDDEMVSSNDKRASSDGERDSSNDEGDSKSEKQIQIYFTTNIKNGKYKIENTTYTIPVCFKRIDLSRMVKKLLDIKENISFDFLINQKIIRSSIEDFLKENNILSEQVLEIEYTIPIRKRESTHIDKISEWISKMITSENTLHCSSFEGNILYYDLRNMNKIYENRVSDSPIFAYNVCKINNSILNDEPPYHESVVGLSNGTIRVFLNEEDIDKGIRTKNDLYLGYHDDMIKSLEFNKDHSLIISGGCDNKINIYDNKYIIEQLKIYKNQNTSNKRKIKNVIAPKKCIHKEPGIITALSFFDNSKFLSTGLEKNIKIYDIITGNICTSFAYNKSVVCCDILNKNLFVTADEQSIIKLFDIRCVQEKSVISLNENKYYFHDKIITSLRANRNRIHFLSSSHDGYINIYDVRLNKLPVYTIENEDKRKILSCTWFYKEDNNFVVSADEINLTVHRF